MDYVATGQLCSLPLNASYNQIVEPSENRPTNEAVQQGPDQTNKAARRTQAVAPIHTADKGRVGRRTLKGNYPPGYLEETKSPEQPTSQSESLYIKSHVKLLFSRPCWASMSLFLCTFSVKRECGARRKAEGTGDCFYEEGASPSRLAPGYDMDGSVLRFQKNFPE